MSKRPTVISCAVFGGRSPNTGQPVGSRHSWSGGSWGVGPCRFCGRYLEEVLKKPAPPKDDSLDAAIARSVE